MAKTLNVFCAGAVKSALVDLVRAFEQRSGYTVQCTFGSTGSLQDKVAAGESADVVLLNRSSVDQLAQQGKVLAATIADIGRVGVGVAVRTGSPVPDVSTPEALRAALRAAGSVTFGDPAKGDSSGIHFSRVIAKLGLVDELRDKIVLAPLGLAVAEFVDQGKVELGATQATVILASKGITLAGLLPASLQHITTYALGVTTQAVPGGHELADYLTSAAVRSSFGAAGFAQ